MLVTLFTDASVKFEIARATWACWAKADGVTHRYSGIIRNTINQSGDAELCAIANGLFVVIRRFAPPIKSKIIIQTDSDEAIYAIKSGKHTRPYTKLLLNNIYSTLQKHDLYCDLRHVKGHKGTATPRNAVNTWCDVECRRQMQILLDEIAPELPLKKATQL